MVNYDKINLLGNNLENAPITHEYSCDASAAVGDIVYFSSDNFVTKQPDNKGEVSVGVITEKVTSVLCKVLTYGPCFVTFSGLLVSKKVFLSSTGVPTSTKPSGGFVEVLGVCYEANKVFVNLSMGRVKQNPF